VATAATVDDLKAQLEARQKALQDAEDKISQFKQNIQIKKQEAITLQSQIALMDQNINSIQLSINKTLAQIDETHGEITQVASDIAEKDQELDKQKGLLADYIRGLHDLDQQSVITDLLKYDSFSQVVNEASTFDHLHDQAQQTFREIKNLQDQLVQKKNDLQDYQTTLQALKDRQVNQQKTLDTQRQAKQAVLDLTHNQESQFKDLLAQAQKTHQQAEADISRINDSIQAELQREGITSLPSIGLFDWPIDPIFGVSCEFHCAGYPYAYLIGPHSGMDIPTYVGTPIHAPADGFVARLYDSGGPGYSFILMEFGDNISAIFGHVSGFAGNVHEGQLVSRGTVIGYTGGAPGMHGAGLSSGPHLHFEVRKSNVPVNPRGYLKPQP